MKPAKLDLPTIWRGCDWGPVILKWKDQNGNPISLNGWTPKAQSLNINLQPVITDAAQGITQISLTRTDTANLRLGVENWDWIWERVTGAQYRFPPFLSGKVPIKEPLTSTNGQHPITPPPANDNWADAIEIQGEAGGPEIGTTINATRETGEPAGENSVWYKWTPNREKVGVLKIGMNWLTIQVYILSQDKGSTPLPLPPETGFHDLVLLATSSGDPSVAVFNAVPGVTYYIRLFKAIRPAAFNLYWHMEIPQ